MLFEACPFHFNSGPSWCTVGARFHWLNTYRVAAVSRTEIDAPMPTILMDFRSRFHLGGLVRMVFGLSLFGRSVQQRSLPLMYTCLSGG